jgi:hypothetical protein
MKTNKNFITNGSLALKQVAKEKNYIGMISGFFAAGDPVLRVDVFAGLCAAAGSCACTEKLRQGDVQAVY